MSDYSFHDEIPPFFSIKFYWGGAAKGLRMDIQGWEMIGIEMHDVKDRENKEKECKLKEKML